MNKNGNESPPGDSESASSQPKDDSRTGVVIGLAMFGMILVLMIVAQLLRT